MATPLEAIPRISVPAEHIHILSGPESYRETLLQRIAAAQSRIFLATLYLQDDDGGREILAALYAAKEKRPQLEIAVFVDWHRAQRGLIGKLKSAGNAALYRAMAEHLGPGIRIYGVPVQRREFLGVMHLKGFVIDDCVLYSGASLNDVYLQRHERYRLDRYHLIESPALAACMASYLNRNFLQSSAVIPLDTPSVPKTSDIRLDIERFRHYIARARYAFEPEALSTGSVGITPLSGLGPRGNELNSSILQLILQARRSLVIFTPYFNLPGSIRRALNARLKAGCRITIILGDKTANDFFIPLNEPFKTIGTLPYLYEANLRRFCKSHQRAIDNGLLNVHLWRHGDNTYHLKGLLVDEDYALLTGNNLNPRAWRLDLENGLLIHDPDQLLLSRHRDELAHLLQHAVRLDHYSALDDIDTYPAPVQRLIRRLARVRADRLINQLL
jgi:CDP-diacylglycerol---serine O-phosphatidyltransferase